MPNDVTARRVAVVGMGTMGGGVVRNLLAHGFAVTGYDTDAATRVWAQEQGADTADELAKIADVDTVILMLPNPDVLRKVVMGPDGLSSVLRPGSTVVEMATDGPEPVRECAAELARRGVDLIDSPVGGGEDQAANGSLKLLVGADEDLVARHRWLLDALGEKVVHCGTSAGSGQTVKLLNNMIACTNVAVLAEAHLVAVRAGIDPAVLGELGCTTAADSWQLRNALVRRWPQQDFAPGFRLSLARKDLRLGLELASTYGLDESVRCASGAYSWYGEAVDDGHGDLDMTAMLLRAQHLAERTSAADDRSGGST